MMRWFKGDERAPDSWTEERRLRVIEIERANGDPDEARRRWDVKAHLQFGASLVDQGHVGEDDRG